MKDETQAAFVEITCASFKHVPFELQDPKTGRPWSGSNSSLWIVGQSSKCKSCERFPRSSFGRSCTVISRGAARKFESGAPAIKRFASVALLLSPGRNLIWPRGFPSARNFSSCLCSSGERNEQMKNERTRWKKSWRKKRPDETRSTSLLPGGKRSSTWCTGEVQSLVRLGSVQPTRN